MNTYPRLLYTSFDSVPGCKGANTHIEAFARAIGRRYAAVVLVTPGQEDSEVRPFAEGVRHLVLGCPDDNPIGRSRTFGAKLRGLLQRQPFELIHFRSSLEGYPLVTSPLCGNARLLYEANGFPSVEMKYHYRGLSEHPAMCDKLRRQETACLNAADHIMTVSQVNRQHILDRGILSEKVSVIPNGVDPRVFYYREPPSAEQGRLEVLYLGTLTYWQGIETLLDAVRLVGQHRVVRLRLAGPASKQRRSELEQVIGRNRMHHQVEFLTVRSRATVARLLHESHMTVVPLLAVDRNTQQGCCPLKLLEAMFTGCPVIATDLPVVRELAAPLEHYLPVRPGDARNLKNVILQLAADPALARRLAQRAHAHVAEKYTWERACGKLLALYESLLSSVDRTSASRRHSTSGVWHSRTR